MKTPLIAIAFCCAFLNAIAQDDLRWSEWMTVYENGNNRVEVSYTFKECGNVAGTYMLRGYSYFRTRNATVCEKCWVKFDFEYPDCDGVLKTTTVRVDMSKTGVDQNMGYWFLGPKLTRRFYNVKFENYGTANAQPKPLSFPSSTSSNASSQDNTETQGRQRQADEQALALKKQQEAQARQAQLQQQRQQQLLQEINSIQERQRQQSQQIWNTHGSLLNGLAQMQQENIRRYTKELFGRRDEAFRSLQRELKETGATMEVCADCDGTGIQECGRCHGDPFSTCNLCGGTGKTTSFGTTTSCGTCYGQGQKSCSGCSGVGSKLCMTCYGKGGEVSYASLASQPDETPSYTASTPSSYSLPAQPSIIVDATMTPEAMYSYAEQQYQQKNFPAAYSYYKASADRGHAQSQVKVGAMLDKGEGVEKNNNEAFNWYSKAAMQGLADGQLSLGFCYDVGKGVARDESLAIHWYKKAAQQGSAYAQTNLGSIYSDFRSPNVNYSEAVKWYKMAADQGNSYGQVKLAEMYWNGRGVTKDYSESFRLLKLAADKGDSQAFVQLGLHYQTGWGVEKNFEQAIAWYRKAMEKNNPNGTNYLNSAYWGEVLALKKGEGVQKDFRAAIKYAESGLKYSPDNANLLFEIGDAYFKGGFGITQDYAKAVPYLKRAAEKGLTDGMDLLGYCYEEGLGVPKDVNEAIQWYERASANRSDFAAKRLQIIRSK